MSNVYIHGFSKIEQLRLIEQANTLAPAVFDGLRFDESEMLLEVGCGVGAQTRQLLQRWPGLKITAIDQSSTHLLAAADGLGEESFSAQVRLFRAKAETLPFDANVFDTALTIWVLEHVLQPELILAEMVRVLKPGGRIILTEVDNATFRFFPRNQIIEDWWSKFNRLQQAGGADPFIGQSLAQLAQKCGLAEIKEEPLYLVSSAREPQRRLELLRYSRDLLLSGAASLKQAGYIEDADAAALQAEFERLESCPEVDFQYLALRLSAVKPG